MKMIPAFYLNHDRMQALAQQHAESFKNAKPFRHTYIDNFLPDDIANMLADEFPGPGDIPWERGGDRATLQTMHKLGHSNEEQFAPLTRHVMHEFNSSTFIRFLTTLTGQAGLIVDPHFRASGLNSTGRGGKLMIHADKSRHPNKKVYQIFNMIYFLNRDWKEEWGGHLELCQFSTALHFFLPAPTPIMDIHIHWNARKTGRHRDRRRQRLCDQQRDDDPHRHLPRQQLRQ